MITEIVHLAHREAKLKSEKTKAQRII